MNAGESVEMVRRIRRELIEEEERLGRDEFLRRQHERVAKFLEGTQARFNARDLAYTKTDPVRVPI